MILIISLNGQVDEEVKNENVKTGDDTYVSQASQYTSGYGKSTLYMLPCENGKDGTDWSLTKPDKRCKWYIH